MKIGLIVGQTEQHQMELSFDHVSGALRVLLDGTLVLEDSPKLVKNKVTDYELSVGDHEKHKLALHLAYEVAPDEPVLKATPRVSLSVTQLGTQDVVPETLGPHGADKFIAAGAAAAA